MFEVTQHLAAFTGEEFSWEVTSVIDHYYCSRDSGFIPDVAPLDIQYYGSQSGFKGLNFKLYGPIRLTFDNVGIFYRQREIEALPKRMKYEGVNPVEILETTEKLGSNYAVVEGITKRLIERLNPVHLIVCTELEVSPLTAHAIWHRDWRDFLTDLEKIATSFDRESAYFADFDFNDPILQQRYPKGKQPTYSFDPGHLRRWGWKPARLQRFLSKVQMLSQAVKAEPERLRNVSRELVYDCFSSLEATQAEDLNGSYYLSVPDPPFEYLDEPYFRLFEKIYL